MWVKGNVVDGRGAAPFKIGGLAHLALIGSCATTGALQQRLALIGRAELNFGAGLARERPHKLGLAHLILVVLSLLAMTSWPELLLVAV